MWGTGFVGKLVIAEIIPHPAFELVGVGVSNPDKVGSDAGEICGTDPIGITATDEVEALIELEPDALVHYGPTAASRRTTTSTSWAPSSAPASTSARRP